MVTRTAEELEHTCRVRVASAATTLAVMASLLALDGQLGPLSLAIRRAIAFAVLSQIAITHACRGGAWRRCGWGATIAALAMGAGAPYLAVAVVGVVAGLALTQAVVGSRSTGVPSTGGLVPTCLCYVALRFTVELVPQARVVAETAGRIPIAYVTCVRGSAGHLSFAGLGGPAIVMAVMGLLWSWRRAGGVGRLRIAAALAVGWLALLPVATPEVSSGPLAAFSRVAGYGLFWLGVAALADAFLPGTRSGSPAPIRAAAHWPPVAAAGIAAALAGLCLVGTTPFGLASPRSIRVHNYGGLDWELPVFGRFGSFSAGMFGLLPIYCRADGYDFDVIDHIEASGPAETTRSPHSPNAAQPRASASSPGGRAGPPSSSKGGAPASRRAVSGSSEWTGPPGGAAGASDSAAAPHASVASRHTDTIVPADLANTQILVLINSPKAWKDPDRRVVLDFVARGGSLLVLGDHTDVFGLMRGFNTLLGPLGIKFRFDSAYKARETWRGCQAAAPDLVAWRWDDENPGVAVGASLELSGNARPLLVGRYAFSDAGIRENIMGSFLGNYHYDRGEQLGDVVLVATVTHGKGRVVVWGDTSAFQGGLSSSYRKVVGPMLAWLSRPAAWTERPAVRTAAALGLLAAILWCWIVAATPKQLALISFSLLVGMLVPWALSLPNLNARPHVDHEAFLIDRSHMEATGHYEAKVNPIGPLYTNLFRSGFRVLDIDEWDPAAIGRARRIAFVAPQKSITSPEVDGLLRAEEDGAVVILATGQPDSAGSRPLLAAHDLALEPRPMGTVTSAEPTASRREREQHPRFLDAWPIVTVDERDASKLPGVEVIYRQGDDVVALFRRMGKGGLLLISDTRFFSDMNVEDMSGYWVGNLALIHDLFKKYLGADPDAVKPLFRSPEKPP